MVPFFLEKLPFFGFVCNSKKEIGAKNNNTLSFNFYFEVQNFMAQPNPAPQEYGLNRADDGEISLPRSLVPVSTGDGNSSPLPSFGFVLFF